MDLKFDRQKTEDLIKTLETDGVSIEIENIDHYIKKKGVIVNVKAGGGKSSYSISPKIYGVDTTELKEDAENFLKKHIKGGKVSFLSDDEEKKIIAIESKLRKKRKELSIGFNNSFMPIESYTEFKEYFNQAKRDYFQLRDELVAKFDTLVEDYVRRVSAALQELGTAATEDEFNSLMNKIPTQDEFKNSFYMELIVTAFPVAENLDIFSPEVAEDVKKGINEGALNILYESMGSALDEAFLSMLTVINSNSLEKIHPNVINGIKNAINRVKRKNILGNPKVDEIVEKMREMIDVDIDNAMQIAEIVISKIYLYTKEMGIINLISINKSPFSLDELEEMSKIYLS